MTIVGLDAAVKDKDIGCVRGEYSNGSFTVTDRWNRKEPLVEVVVDWLQNSKQAILAIDAPLGWPVNFRKILNAHCAGRALKIDPELFFKRKTDLDIKNRFKKTTLEITADRIARTAFFTLERVGRVENKLENMINLLWKPQDLSRFGMIEVYPAATLLANGFSIKGYKKKRI